MGNVVSLRPGQTYRLSEKLSITKSNSGILTTGTPAVLYLMNTFNNVEPLQMWDTTRVDSIAIRAEGSLGALLNNIRLENFKINKQYLDGTYVSAAWFRGVKNSKIVNLDITGFALGPIVALDSVDNVNIRGCSIHDSWATYVNSYAKFPQLSGIVVDDSSSAPRRARGREALDFVGSMGDHAVLGVQFVGVPLEQAPGSRCQPFHGCITAPYDSPTSFRTASISVRSI